MRAAVLGLLLLAAPLAPASATTSQGDTAAVAVNTTDGSSLFRLAFSVRRVTDSVVDQTNAAVAYASCTECETVAVAIQLILVFSDPEVVTPTNLAYAFNDQCSHCLTLAWATQVVLGTDGPARFTAEGNRHLAELRNRLQALRTQELTVEQLEAELAAINAELKSIVSSELVAGGAAGSAGGFADGTTTSTTSTTSSTTGSTTSSTATSTTTSTRSSATTSTTSTIASTTTPATSSTTTSTTAPTTTTVG